MDWKVALQHAPQELMDRPQWVVYRLELRDGRPTKVPYDAKTGQRASTTDPRTWSTFKQAARFAGGSSAYGVGFVFCADDPYVGLDFDDVRDPDTGLIAPWAKQAVEEVDSYTEVSPSGTGLHVFVKGKLPPNARHRRAVEGGEIELYESGRYFTVTGQHLEGTPPSIEDRGEQFGALYAQLFPTAPEEARGPREAWSTGLSDEEVLEHARSAANGARFERLWRGEYADEYPSQSEADLALCAILAFYTGPDPVQIDRLFRGSGLYRPKWDQRHFGDGRTYGQATIERALGGAREFYRGQQAEQALPPTDYGNAQRLVRRHGADLRYCPVWGKWLVWDGRCWVLDETGEIVRRAKETVRSIYAEAAATADDQARGALAAHARRSESERAIKAMIELAKTE